MGFKPIFVNQNLRSVTIMDTYYADSENILIFPCENEPGKLRELINSALRENGIDAWRNIEAELFCLGGKTLVIARPLSPTRERRFRRSGRKTK